MGNSTYMVFQAGQPDDQPKRDPSKPNKFLKPGPEGQVGFNSQQEFLDAIADERYTAPGAEGEEYREAVQIVLRNSNLMNDPNSNEGKAAQRQADWKSDEDRAILREHIQSLMSDPRYETSTLFRKQVREQIEANPGLFEKASPSPTRVNGRVQLQADDFDAAQKSKHDERLKRIEAEKQDAIARAEAYAKQQYIDIDGSNASDEDDSE